MIIRAFQPSDLADVVRCFTESVRVIAGRYYDARQIDTWAPIDADLVSWRERLSNGCVLVAEVQSSVAGFTRAERNGLIDLIYVHPAHERRGIGAELLAAACAWAAANGAKRLEANVSFAAKPLFEAAGFRVEREQAVQYKGVTFNNFKMSRDSNAAPTVGAATP